MATSRLQIKPSIGMLLAFKASADVPLADVPARVIYVGPCFSSGDYLVTLEYERPMKWGSEYITTIDAFMSELYQPAVSPSSRKKGLLALAARH